MGRWAQRAPSQGKRACGPCPSRGLGPTPAGPPPPPPAPVLRAHVAALAVEGGGVVLAPVRRGWGAGGHVVDRGAHAFNGAQGRSRVVVRVAGEGGCLEGGARRRARASSHLEAATSSIASTPQRRCTAHATLQGPFQRARRCNRCLCSHAPEHLQQFIVRHLGRLVHNLRR